MKNLLKVIVLVALTCVGCGPALGPAFQKLSAPPADKGVIYFYRTSYFGTAVQPTVYEGDEKHPIAKLVPGGYYPYVAEPGTHTYYAKTEARSEVSVDVRAGEEYYVKGSIGMGFLVGHPHLSLEDNAVGANEIKECKIILKENK